MHKSQLLSRIQSHDAVVAVVGLGYVGLPLAMEFAEAGFTVIGYDVSERVVALLNAGESHIQDISAALVAKHVASGRFIATTDAARMKASDAISIAVPTPLGKTRDPDMTYVHAATQAVVAQAHPGLLIVLESTTYPGTTREVLQPAIEAAGFTVVPKSDVWNPNYLNAVDTGQTGLRLLGWTGDFGDPDNFIGTFFRTKQKAWGPLEASIYTDLDAARTEPDLAKRTELYKAANKKIMEFLPGVPYVHTKPALAFVKGVEGYVPSPVSIEDFSKVSLSK